ncbi:caspase family protein [Portibacter marinus]|uniref:caspase family protein n=1 Tax=Portibacter marinus TaxID=2898660 RepID=UPI001F281D41|nr:caspase family protein [Portibacter marinus]
MNRVYLISALVLLCASLLSGQCVKGNCNNGKGTYIFKSGSKYSGEFKNGKIHHYGTLFFSDGKIYKGQWSNQRRHGKGVLKFLDGSIYSGDFNMNVRHGRGKLKLANGDVYDGQWVNDALEGQGFIEYADGSKRMVRWVNGVIQGGEPAEHTTIAANPAPKPNKKPVNNNSTAVQNCNKYNCGNGTGRYTYRDGSYYEGQFVNGLPQGQGICYYSNGDRYEGGWKNNAPEGEGVMHFASGTVYGAIWNAGYPVKKIHASAKPSAKKQTEVAQIEKSKEVKIWAVIVGIASYNHMPTLKYTDDDAYQVYAFLKSPEGGAIPDERIALLIDESASRNRILSEMEATFSKADENDVIMLYYSGHGLPGSFLPIDFDGYNNVLQHHEIKSILDKSQAKHKIVFADACHSGSMLAMKAPFDATRMQSLLNGYENAAAGTALFTSSKSEEISMETSGLRQGIYSHYLIRGLRGEADKNGNKIVTISELFEFVNKNVRRYTSNRQTPVIAGTYDQDMPVSIVR